MTVHELRKRNPWRLDQVVRYSGVAYHRSAARDKHVAHAHGLSISRGTRYRNGDVNAPLTKALAALALSDVTTAWPAVIEGMALVTQVEIERASDEALAARRLELETVEHDAERDENYATWSHDDAAAEDAHARKAAIHIELYAIIREQRERRQRHG